MATMPEVTVQVTVNPTVPELMRLCIARTSPMYTCKRGPRASGALLLLSNLELIYGYVRPSRSSPTCLEIGCMIEDGHCVRNNHAEVDALLTAAKRGLTTRNGWMFSINKPCYQCTRAIIAAGIWKVFYAYAVYNEERTQAICDAAGLEVIRVPLDV